MNSRFEYIFIFTTELNPTRQIKTNAFRNISNVFELNPSGKNDFAAVHAAVFPVEFAQHFISMATKCGAFVLEPFCGSGTTIIAC
jgi:DNA modification methylase